MSFIDQFFSILEVIDTFFWSYIGFTLIVAAGLYFTIKTNFFQFRTIVRLKHVIQDLQDCGQKSKEGVHPLRLYFASVGGMVGLGNVVGIITALIIGGPGALFWLWVASFSGMLIKYAEIYLGVRYRVQNDKGGYDGGPMYYLNHAFNSKVVSCVVALLLCIYGVEVYQFLIITDTVSTVFNIQKEICLAVILALVVYTVLGGINRLAAVCTVLMPVFIIMYILMCLWVISGHFQELPHVLTTVFQSAFTGHSAVGGFAGSTFILAAQQGIARGVYSGDIGIGYDATLQAETRTQYPERQARMAVFALLTDAIICTMSMLVVLSTDLWQTTEAMQASEFVARALSLHFPYMSIFMAVFFFLAGFTTIIAYNAVGMKSAKFLSPKWGEKLYFLYGICAFTFFSFFDQNKVILIMSVSGGLLLMFNLAGILKLRKQIEFK